MRDCAPKGTKQYLGKCSHSQGENKISPHEPSVGFAIIMWKKQATGYKAGDIQVSVKVL